MHRHILHTEHWAKIILGWDCKAVVELGKAMLKAKQELGHGQFYDRLLPRIRHRYGKRAVQKYMAIAKHPIISKAHNWSLLPTCWTTLYALTRVPEAKLVAAMKSGKVRPSMTLKEATALRYDEREVPIPPEFEIPCITEPGDTWILGKHRLRCGDATNEEDVRLVMARERAHLCVADPPWGIGGDYDGYEDSKDNLLKLIETFLPHVLAVSDVVFITPGVANVSAYPEYSWMFSIQFNGGPARCPWGFSTWQPVLAYGLDPYLQKRLGCQPDSFQFQCSREEGIDHPCPKPQAMWNRLVIRGSTDEGDILFDPFLGSGTTLLAASQLKRRCYAIEQNPRYCDLAVRRWELLTGRKALRPSTTRTVFA